MCNLSQGIKEDALAEGREAGIAEGREAGIAEGREANRFCRLQMSAKRQKNEFRN